jgi:diguanylate cyclase (GGDEF)-like protein
LFIDLDGFKAVNDSLGHDYGDILLKNVSERLTHCVRKNDFVARLGGDEFTIILKEITAKNRINSICDDILATLSKPFNIKNEEVHVSGSVGITLYPEDSTSVENLVKNADQAMYESKEKGKNCCSYFSQDVRNKLTERRTLVDELKAALKRQEFEIHYQPILNLRTGKVCKAEALIRWHHPTKGLLFPNDFLSIMEEEGLMDELGFWIATQATSDAMYWLNNYSEAVQVSINISPSQFCHGNGKLQLWLDSLVKDKVDAKQIVIEITEHSFMENSVHASKLLGDMRALGIGIAVDDFGVGYSSFSYLQQLDLDILKIDKSFVNNLTLTANGFKLCRAIIGVAHQLGLTVIAEGIETNEQKRMLVKAGCDLGQGYLFSKPIPVLAFEQQFLSSIIVEQDVEISSQYQTSE